MGETTTNMTFSSDAITIAFLACALMIAPAVAETGTLTSNNPDCLLDGAWAGVTSGVPLNSWTVSESSARFDFVDSLSCGGSANETQTGSLTKSVTLDASTEVTITAYGMAESDYEEMKFSVDDSMKVIAKASAAAGTLIKTCGVGEDIVSVPASSTTITLDAGTYDFKFEVTSVDGQANSGFFQMGISAGTCIATAVKNDGSTDAQTSTEPRQQRRAPSTAAPTSKTSAEPSTMPSAEPTSKTSAEPTSTTSAEPSSEPTDASTNAPTTDAPTNAPTNAETTVIVVTFEVAGNVEDFDADSFIAGLAVLLGIEKWQITIVSVQRRSITVVTNVVAETKAQASVIEVSLSEVTELDVIGGSTVLGAVSTECSGVLCPTNAPTTAATAEFSGDQDGNPASKVQASNMSTLFVALLVIMIISF